MVKNWQQLSVEALERKSYGQPEPGDSNLIIRCKTFVKIPVGKLSVEQLCTLISQRIALPYLVPLAFEILKSDILAEGDLYPGDLLESVNKVKAEFEGNPTLLEAFNSLLKTNAILIKSAGLNSV